MRVKHKGEAGRDSIYWIMGGWNSLSINGWVGHNGGVDLKMGVNSFQSNFGATKDTKILNKTSTFWPNAPRILSKCIPELAQDTYSFAFSCL